MLSVDEREAFAMVEIGESIITNFCVWNIQQTPMATVLESRIGTVEVLRTRKDMVQSFLGLSSGVSFKDQYADRTLDLVIQEDLTPTY